MSRRLRYQVAVSPDGFIAGPNGEYDWIVMDPSIDFAALVKEFDTAVMGRKTHEVLAAHGGHGALPGLDVVVFSRTLPPATFPGVRIGHDDPCETVATLKSEPGRDIWLYGGGTLFRSLLDAGLVDTVEVAVVPVLLGAGIPLLPPSLRRQGANRGRLWRRIPRSRRGAHPIGCFTVRDQPIGDSPAFRPGRVVHPRRPAVFGRVGRRDGRACSHCMMRQLT